MRLALSSKYIDPYRNFTSIVNPLTHIVQSLLGTLGPNCNCSLIIPTKEIMVSVSCGRFSSVFPNIEHWKVKFKRV